MLSLHVASQPGHRSLTSVCTSVDMLISWGGLLPHKASSEEEERFAREGGY